MPTLDGIAATKKPAIFTHASCRALAPGHLRCKTDEMITGMAKTGGVMGIPLIRFMIKVDEPVTQENVLDHFDHVAKLVGLEHVGVGGDLDLDKAAQLGTVVGDSQPVMKQALQQYFRMGFWTVNGSGMPAANINHMIAVQIAVGNLKQATAPTYAKIVDQGVYQQAAKLAS